MVGYFSKIGIAALSLAALINMTVLEQAHAAAPAKEADTGGAVFAMTNVTENNRVITYRRAANGALTKVDSISTRGSGIGTDLDTTGGLRLSSNHRFLYAVNAGSDDITVFAVSGTSLTFLQKVYAGDMPNSLTLHRNLLYVLNGSVAGNGIRGFRIGADGRLTELPNSFRLLSSPIAVPGQVQFSPDGRLLVVTQKVSDQQVKPANAIDVFTVRSDGLASTVPLRNLSNGLRPFSLDFRSDGRLVVVESFNAAAGKSAASSYQLLSNGRLSVISGSVANKQTDVCWVMITKDGRYAYTANFGSGTISSYGINSAGELRLIDGKAAFLGDLSQPVDLAQSANSRFLYLLLRGTGKVAAFRVKDNGSLVTLGTVVGGLPVNDGASGLAAF